MKHIILIFASFLIALFVFSDVNADQQVTMEIKGMTCKL
jgi:hypothetical protein